MTLIRNTFLLSGSQSDSECRLICPITRTPFVSKSVSEKVNNCWNRRLLILTDDFDAQTNVFVFFALHIGKGNLFCLFFMQKHLFVK